MNAIIVHQKSIAELGEMFGENQKIENRKMFNGQEKHIQ